MQCSMAEAPLLHLLLWQMLAIAATAVSALAAGQSAIAEVCCRRLLLQCFLTGTANHSSTSMPQGQVKMCTVAC